MTLSRIQTLQSLGFVRIPSYRFYRSRKGTLKKNSLDDDAACVRERATEAPKHVQTTAQPSDREICTKRRKEVTPKKQCLDVDGTCVRKRDVVKAPEQVHSTAAHSQID